MSSPVPGTVANPAPTHGDRAVIPVLTSALAVNRELCATRARIFGQICHCVPVTRTGPHDYVLFMLSTLLVIGGVLVGLFVLLALIVSLSARPQVVARGDSARGGHGPGWVADAGRPHRRPHGHVGGRCRPSAPGRVVAAVHHDDQRDPGRPLSS